jgi:hypothetical protein
MPDSPAPGVLPGACWRLWSPGFLCPCFWNERGDLLDYSPVTAMRMHMADDVPGERSSFAYIGCMRRASWAGPENRVQIVVLGVKV